MAIFFIAEIGINHNGSMDLCKKLIDVAHDAGCDAVKFQKRDIDLVYTKEYLDGPRESPWGTTQRHQKAGLEFNADQYHEISRHCENKGILWLASSWDKNSQVFMRQFNCLYNKIASPMLVDKEFLQLVASEGKHTFISTGMSTLQQISDAVEIFRNTSCSFELMHAVSAYPLKTEDVNLQVINTLKKTFACDVGYSGHEPGLAISYAAAAMGISSLERHITLDRAMYGSDQSASIEPSGLRMLVGAVRKIELAMGDGVKRITAEEKDNSRKLRQHLTI